VAFIVLVFKGLILLHSIKRISPIPNFTQTGQEIWHMWEEMHLYPYIRNDQQ